MNKYFTLIIGICFPALALSGAVTGKIVIDGMEYGDSVVRGNHQRAEQRRTLPCFERIRLLAAVDVSYQPADRCQVRLTGDSNLLDLIVTDVRGDTLVIDARRSFQSEGPLQVQINSPRFRELDVQSAADVHLRRLKGPDLTIRADGSSDLRADGRTGRLEVLANGSGTLDLGRLESNHVHVRVSGAADVIVHARDSLTVDLSGAGDVLYYGHPAEVNIKNSGAGDVEAAE